MNESVIAYRGWQSINDYLDWLISDYFQKDGDGDWGDGYLIEIADAICDEYDKLVPVLEWLEKKFE